ncbi:hypothetical protein AVEN_44827-1 [Araneus ventricosus]|uniref:Uncharacterized protein n=1 Tax=Araneus ventricosus TaxID=182803 RepID=A0A4Y2CLS7_ARAVE|nr:hypothetical protein AVEN_44827-1 [Araneus ventricosus]
MHRNLTTGPNFGESHATFPAPPPLSIVCLLIPLSDLNGQRESPDTGVCLSPVWGNPLGKVSMTAPSGVGSLMSLDGLLEGWDNGNKRKASPGGRY